jgi:hypothetical protein
MENGRKTKKTLEPVGCESDTIEHDERDFSQMLKYKKAQ